MKTIYLQIVLCIKCIFCNLAEFPSDFKFGVATASYQIEGGWNASGKGVNIWDTLSHTHPNWIKDHTSGDLACDSYHLWQTDVKLLKTLGVNFYRFSLSWSRLLPTGFNNQLNPDGVQYYNSLIDALLQNKIEPFVTLYHWDLPQPLQDLGGWPNPILAKYFKEYAEVAFTLFGDRVKTWITFNEPIEVCGSGYGTGTAAPGLRFTGIADYLCGKTLLVAHANAYNLYTTKFRESQNGMVGMTISADWGEPKTQNQSDIDAAERYMQMNFGWWMHPIYTKSGDYPQVMKDRIAELSKKENFAESRLPAFSPNEIKYIRGTFDFLGLNHYTSRIISDAGAAPDGNYSYWGDVGVIPSVDSRWKQSAATWLYSVPWAFRKLLFKIKADYGNPLVYVTENGWGDGGQVDDQDRIEYHKDYLATLSASINYDHCNVKAYTAWSLMDNMEWLDGYTIKFGLYYVNFTDPNRERIPKASVNFYKDVIRRKAVELSHNK